MALDKFGARVVCSNEGYNSRNLHPRRTTSTYLVMLRQRGHISAL
jgi:hypothetical protein